MHYVNCPNAIGQPNDRPTKTQRARRLDFCEMPKGSVAYKKDQGEGKIAVGEGGGGGSGVVKSCMMCHTRYYISIERAIDNDCALCRMLKARHPPAGVNGSGHFS